MTPFLRPRRSMLYVPGCFTRFLNKARSLRVDSVIFDLGDSVLVENKEPSRNQGESRSLTRTTNSRLP